MTVGTVLFQCNQLDLRCHKIGFQFLNVLSLNIMHFKMKIFLTRLLFLHYYPRQLCRSTWVGFRVCLSVCLSVCPQHNSKTNDPKVFKLGNLGYPRNNMVLRLKGQRSSRLGLGLIGIRRGFELYEYLLVVTHFVQCSSTHPPGLCLQHQM